MFEVIRNCVLFVLLLAIALVAVHAMTSPDFRQRVAEEFRQYVRATMGMGFPGLRMLANQASAATSTSLLDAVSAANTAAATSGSGKWLDVRVYDGEILVTVNVGAVTGSIACKLQTASDANGTGAADLAGGAFAATAANSCVKLAVDPRAVVGGFLGVVGTIVTGPSLISAVASGKKHVV